MTISHLTIEFVEAYEREYGQRTTELALEAAEHILKVGKLLTELGQKDAQQGKSAYPANVFPALVVKAFRLDGDENHETVQAVADLWKSNYMAGFDSGEGSA